MNSGSSGGSSGSGVSASGSSISSIGLSAYATMLQAQGTATADTFQADRLDVAAQYGDLKASQTAGQMQRNLNTTLGNIDAVRAAANTDPNSPTGAAIRDSQEALGTQQKTIAVDSINAQTLQDRNDAAYYRQASASAITSGEVTAAANAFAALNKMGK